MDRMLVRQRQAHNARDFRPKFIIAFLGESGNLCERRRGTATFAGWGGNDGTTTFATGATSKRPSEAPAEVYRRTRRSCPRGKPSPTGAGRHASLVRPHASLPRTRRFKLAPC